MNITIDTSALIAVIGNERSKPRIIELTKGCGLYAPSSVHWEIGNAFSAMFKRHQLSIALAKQALSAYNQIPIKFIDVPLEKAVALAQMQNIYAYDAYLILCAQQTGTPLLTLDNSLKVVASNTGVQVLEVNNEGI